MPKSNILIAALLLTNAVTGVLLWRLNERLQYQSQKANTFAALYEQEVKKNLKLEKSVSVKTTEGKQVSMPSDIFDSLDKPIRKAAIQSLAEHIVEHKN